MIKYTKSKTIEKCEDALKNPGQFYNAACVKYTGETSDTKIPYTEVIAKFLCENFGKYVDHIPMISREESYKMDTHKGEHDPNSPRKEEVTAMEMFNFCKGKNGGSYPKIGKIIDYQTPLKNKDSDEAGEIDLLAYDKATNTLRILELKTADTEETMLRCVLEGYTYLRTVDQKKLCKDFGIPEDASVKASPFVFKDSLPYKEYQENRPHLKKLMARLESEPIFIVKTATGYEVL